MHSSSLKQPKEAVLDSAVSQPALQFLLRSLFHLLLSKQAVSKKLKFCMQIGLKTKKRSAIKEEGVDLMHKNNLAHLLINFT